jgi:hypothetical protein
MNGAIRWRTVAWAFCALVAPFLGGCRSELLEQDQLEIRQSLLDMYQDEVMDNLIRTQLCLPVIEVDYRTMTGTVTSLSKGSAGYTQTMTHNAFATSGSAMVPLRQISAVPTVYGEQDQTVQLTLTGEPVCDPTIYDAYEQYLFGPNGRRHENSAEAPTHGFPATMPISPGEKTVGTSQLEVSQLPPSNSVYNVNLNLPSHPIPAPPPVPQGRLLCSDKPPAEGTYHLVRQFGDKWYFIPPDSAEAFFELYKRVVLSRSANPTNTQSLGDQLELFRLNQMQQ